MSCRHDRPEGWWELRPAPPRRPGGEPVVTGLLRAAAAGRIPVHLVAEPYRLALLLPGSERAARVAAAQLPEAELVRCPALFAGVVPPAGARGSWRSGAIESAPPEEGSGLLLAALAAATRTPGEGVLACLDLAPATPGDRARALAGDAGATTGARIAAGVGSAAESLLQGLLDAVLPDPARTRSGGAGDHLHRDRLTRDPLERDRFLLARDLAVRLRLTVAWHAPDRAAAAVGLDHLAAASGLDLRRGRARPVPLTAASLARLLDPGPDPTGWPAHLARASLRPAEPSGPPPGRGLGLATTAAGRAFGLAPDDLAGHAYVLGPSGTGKTTLLARVIVGLAERDVAAVVLDPHGDLTRRILAALPEPALARTALFDLTDPARLPALNPLHVPTAAPVATALARAVRTAAVGAVFADLWELRRAQTPNLLHFLDAALAALVATGDGCLADLPRFLTDPAFRTATVRRGGDERVRRRWQEFAALRADDRSRTVRAILNKAGEFDRNPVLATVFGERGAGLRLDAVLDGGGLLLVHLPRGLVPEGTVELIGSLIVTLLHQAALAREARPPEDRPLAVAVIDEFQEFALRAFAQVVTATRKYGLGMVVANQNLSRVAAVSPDVLSTLLNNVATLATFRPGAGDAALLAPQFAPLGPPDLLALPPHGCYWRLAPAGRPRELVAAVALPPLPARRTAADVESLLPELRARLPGRPLQLPEPDLPPTGGW